MRGLKFSERRGLRALQKQGYKVLRSGWPDFLAIKNLDDGGIEAIFVEVKSGSDRVHNNQRRMHEALERLGLRVLVLRPGETAGVPAQTRHEAVKSERSMTNGRTPATAGVRPYMRDENEDDG